MGRRYMHGIIYFFLELATSQGRLLKIDDLTSNKDHLDYARLLVATPMVKEVNVVVDFWIGGTKYATRIIEDVGFGLAEDACLADYEDDNKSLCSIPMGMHENEPLVDSLVQQLHEDWKSKSVEDKVDGSVTVHQVTKPLMENSVQLVVKEDSGVKQ